MDTEIVTNGDYFKEYKNISSKLKKRFLRRPNVTEAADEFERLQRRLLDVDVFGGAAECAAAAAECNGSSLATAATCLSKGCCDRNALRCPGDVIGGLAACCQMYERAIAGRCQKYDDCQGSAALHVQQAKTLALSGASSTPALQTAASLLHGCPLQQGLVLGRLQEEKVHRGDLMGALDVGAKILNLGTHDDDNQRVLCLLLCLLLEPLENALPAVLQNLLKAYRAPQPMPGELGCLLQSLVVSCDLRDAESVAHVIDEIAPHFRLLPLQLHLLLML